MAVVVRVSELDEQDPQRRVGDDQEASEGYFVLLNLNHCMVTWARLRSARATRALRQRAALCTTIAAAESTARSARACAEGWVRCQDQRRVS